MPDAARIRKALVATRLTIGVSVLIAPRLFARFFGIDPTANRALPYVARLFGVRDALMAYQLYQASDEELEEVLRQGILADGIDFVAGFSALARREISLRTFVMGAGGSAAGMAMGLLARQPEPAVETDSA